MLTVETTKIVLNAMVQFAKTVLSKVFQTVNIVKIQFVQIAMKHI